MSPSQIDAQIYWEYRAAKRQWRRHMGRPTRKVRKFLKRNTGHRLLRGKGKGRGRGAQRYAFLAELSQDEVDEVFFGGKGRGKGKRSSAKGKGRRTNPRGYDGQIMTCDICGSESHFRAQCPQNSGGARPSG